MKKPPKTPPCRHLCSPPPGLPKPTKNKKLKTKKQQKGARPSKRLCAEGMRRGSAAMAAKRALPANKHLCGGYAAARRQAHVGALVGP